MTIHQTLSEEQQKTLGSSGFVKINTSLVFTGSFQRQLDFILVAWSASHKFKQYSPEIKIAEFKQLNSTLEGVDNEQRHQVFFFAKLSFSFLSLVNLPPPQTNQQNIFDKEHQSIRAHRIRVWKCSCRLLDRRPRAVEGCYGVAFEFSDRNRKLIFRRKLHVFLMWLDIVCQLQVDFERAE